jgi:hypothetical protein
VATRPPAGHRQRRPYSGRWRYDALQRVTVRNDELAGHRLVVILRSDTTSIGDHTDLATAPAVGRAGVFDAVVGGRRLQFEPRGDGTLTDRQTGREWDFTGRAVRGPLAGPS